MTTPATPNVTAPPGTLPAATAPRALPPPKPPQPRVSAPTPAATPSKPAAVKASELRPEHLFQRLYFLEGIYRHQRAHIKDLEARLMRTGTAVPTMPHFDPLKSPAGDIDPNVG